MYRRVCGDCTRCCCWTHRVGLRGIPGATDTTRTTTPRVSPCIITSTSEGRTSKKVNIVDNECLDRDSSDGVEGNMYTSKYTSYVHHPGKYLLYWHEVPGVHVAEIYAKYLVHTSTVMYTYMIHTTLHGNRRIVSYSYSCINGYYISAQCGTSTNVHVSTFESRAGWFLLFLPHDAAVRRDHASSCCVSRKKAKKWKTKLRLGAPRLTDNRWASTSFEITTTQSLPSFFCGEYGDRLPLSGFTVLNKSKRTFVQGIRCAHENGNFL